MGAWLILKELSAHDINAVLSFALGLVAFAALAVWLQPDLSALVVRALHRQHQAQMAAREARQKAIREYEPIV